MIGAHFSQIASLSALASLLPQPGFGHSRLARVIVAPAQPLTQPRRLIADEVQFIDPWVGLSHANGHDQAARDVSCYFARDVGLTGRGHIFIDQSLVMSDDLMPRYWRDLIHHTGAINIDHEWAKPPRVISEKVLVVSGHGVDVYGHFLIETLPKLMVARHVLGPDFGGLKLLLEARTPSWLRQILSETLMIAPERFTFYRHDQERLLLREAVIPSLVSFDGWFHPFAQNMVAETLRLAGVRSDGIAVPRLFVSRALSSNPATQARRCSNEFQLAEIAAKEFGFAVLAPETFPWRAQLSLFHSASVVVGEFGSGLHSTMFAKPGTRVGAVGIASMTQSMIGALQQQDNAYLRTTPNDQGEYTIDPNLFRLFLRKLI